MILTCFKKETMVGVQVCFWFAVMFSAVFTEGSGCGFPGSPAHARVRTTDDEFKEGTLVNFECDDGYQLLGRPSTRCVNSVWDAPGLPFCAREVTYLKPATMTSNNVSAPLAVDDRRKTCAKSSLGKVHTWSVDLLERIAVDVIEIHFGSIGKDMHIDIEVGNNLPERTVSCVQEELTAMKSEETRYFKCEPGTIGKIVHIHLNSTSNFTMELCEVNVFSQTMLSPSDVCGSWSTGKTESFQGACFEITPETFSFAHAREFCRSSGGELHGNGNRDFISWLMNVHNMSGVWIRNESHTVNGNDCIFLPRLKPLNGTETNPYLPENCDKKHFAICVRRASTCGRPSLPKHSASWRESSTLTEGNQGTMRCEDGFSVSGPGNVRCLNNGTLDRVQPSQCLKSICGPPPSIPNGFTVFHERARIFCRNESFILHGDPSIQCNAESRQWSKPLCVCIKLPLYFSRSEPKILDRLLKGIELFPVASRIGIILFLSTVLILTGVWVIFLFNVLHFYKNLKPDLDQSNGRSMMLQSLHEQLQFNNSSTVDDALNIDAANNNILIDVHNERRKYSILHHRVFDVTQQSASDSQAPNRNESILNSKSVQEPQPFSDRAHFSSTEVVLDTNLK